MIPTLFFASSNQDKITEIKTILQAQLPQTQLLTLQEKPELTHEVPETAQTYEGNALLKAQSYQSLINLPIITDDSGMEIAAFPKLLGVQSSRWHSGTQVEKNLAVLAKLNQVENRRLSYHCVICLLISHQSPIFFTGACHGQAAFKPSSQTGFGYDPIFIPDGYQQTLTELGPDIKNKLSHRRQALDQLVAYLSQAN